MSTKCQVSMSTSIGVDDPRPHAARADNDLMGQMGRQMWMGHVGNVGNVVSNVKRLTHD